MRALGLVDNVTVTTTPYSVLRIHVRLNFLVTRIIHTSYQVDCLNPILSFANNLVVDSLESVMSKFQSLSRSFRMPSAISSRFTLPKKPFRSVTSMQSTKSTLWRSIWQDMSLNFGSFSRRPLLSMMSSQNLQFSRGMKVRTSVKKFCDGCRVSKSISHLLRPLSKAD